MSSLLATSRVPPHAYFLVSAVFHYLGPAFAVLLFQSVNVLGVAWFRIASAGLVFALWRRPWRRLRALGADHRRQLLALGLVLAAMNTSFYLAIARLPLGTVAAVEFLGAVTLAALGARGARNATALLLAAGGVYVLTDLRLAAEPLGLAFAFANCVLFMLYVLIGHRIAADGGMSGIDRLGAAMLVATLAVSPHGLPGALPALPDPVLVAAGVGVGVCSSVIPYVCDQLAMARLSRASFALMLALLPATAAVVGAAVLAQIPSPTEVAGIALVVAGVGVHRPPAR